MSRMDTRGFDPPPPLSRPGTRGSDMSRGSGIYGSSPVSRPGTRGTDIPRATSPAPTRSASPQPPMNDSSNMSYRSASPNPYAPSQRSPSVMSYPESVDLPKNTIRRPRAEGLLRRHMASTTDLRVAMQAARWRSSWRQLTTPMDLKQAGAAALLLGP